MAGNDSKSRSTDTSNTATRATRRTIPQAPARDLPMYFEGQQQSAEFARGAWAARDVRIKLEAQSRGADSSVEEVAVTLAGEFNDSIAIGGDYSRGFVAAMAELIAFEEMIGGPDLKIWRPLRMGLRYTRRGTNPTPGSKLFDYGGVPVAIAPDQTVHSWDAVGDVEEEHDPAFLKSVLSAGRSVSEREFNALRAKVEKEVVHG